MTLGIEEAREELCTATFCHNHHLINKIILTYVLATYIHCIDDLVKKLELT